MLRLKADLPVTQSNHLLLIVAFLRGTTNEPPDNWFTKIETWKPQPSGATVITIPDGAQRAIVFVAPDTGGDFDTLRNAVKRNPGVFLRAAAALERHRWSSNAFNVILPGCRQLQWKTNTSPS